MNRSLSLKKVNYVFAIENEEEALRDGNSYR